MIYKNSLFNKELRQSYIESLSSKRRLFAMCVFLALITVVLHMLLQIMYNSVMTELFPELMLPSYFTMTYTYNLVAYLFFAVYFISKYDSMTLSEVSDNKWYMLTKMGYRTTSIILHKMLISVLTVIFLYCAGFLLTMLLSALYKYPFVPGYFLPAVVAGALNVLLIAQATMVISLYSETKIHARNSLLTAIIVNEILKYALGYYRLLTDRVLMVDALNIFKPAHSVYGIIIVAANLLLPVFAYIGAKRKSSYYSLKNEIGGITIVRYNDSAVVVPSKQKKRRILSLPSMLSKILLTAVLLGSIVFNALILVASLGSSTREFSIFGYIPYVFKSSTMEDEIYRNDLALFKQIDEQYPLKVGDTVLFTSKTDSSEVVVMKIVRIDGDKVVTDFLNYPILIEEYMLQETVDRSDIYAIFYDNYRILGAIILFINTFAGRLITLLIPLLLLFFYKQISEFTKRLKRAI